MKIKIFVLFFLSFSSIKAQFVSTVFIDTMDISVNNNKLYSLKETTLKFFPNDKDAKVTIYDDGKYKLTINFKSNKSRSGSSSISSGINFFQYDTAYNFISTFENYYDIEECTEEIRRGVSLQNWYDTIIPFEKIQIRLFYRLFNFAPKDTSNYQHNYKEGLWIGKYKGVDKVTVNFKQNKKHGLASVFYNDSTSFNVNFNNGIADYYGKGYGERYGKSKKLKFSYIRPYIVSSSCDTINASRYNSFYFTRNQKTKEVLMYNDLSIHSRKKGLNNDSIEFDTRGDFIAIINDSMVIRSDEIYVHDFYKINTDSLHSYPKKTTDGFTKIPLKDISKIYYGRDEWKTFTLRTTLVSLATALIVSPLISIQKGGFNGDRFRKVSTYSFGVMILSFSFGIAFSQKEFLILPTKKSNKTWKIIPNHYE